MTYHEDVGMVWTVLAQGEDGIAVSTNYVKRPLDGNFEDGKRRREVYVHESVGSPMEMAQILANALIGLWLKEGELVGSSTVVPGGERAGAEEVGAQPPRTDTGLYLP